MHNNSNWTSNRREITHIHTEFSLCPNNLPVTVHPSQDGIRDPRPMILTLFKTSNPQQSQNNVHEIYNGVGSFINHSGEAFNQNSNSNPTWQNPSGVHPKLSLPESFIINFDKIKESSNVNSRQPNDYHENQIISEQFHINNPIDSSKNNLQNFSNQFNENNNSTLSFPNNNSNYVHNFVNGNSVNDHENSTRSINFSVNSNTVDINIPINQNNEGFRENSNSDTTPESQSFEKLIHKYFPITAFLLVKALYDHRKGILLFVGLIVTFTHANSIVKREIAKQNRRSLLSLSTLFVNLFVCICFIYFVFQEQKLYKSLIFIPPYTQPLNIWDLLWMVGITDFVLKFITIQIKAGMACFPAKLLPYSERGKWYLMLESSSQLYRGLAPIQPWLYYLLEAYQGPEKVIGIFFSVAYMVSKGTELLSKVKLFLKALCTLLQNISLGVHPNKEQLDIAGSQCPICHDVYNTPIILRCRHVFCEGCVTTWFDREQTCPLCRAKIADDPSWRDGATSYFTQLF